MNLPSTETVIAFSHVAYRTNGRSILADLNLEVHRGEILILLGRSGSGKTTALKLINALLPTSEGEIRIEGRPTADWDVIQLRRRIGYAIQEVGLLPHLTVERNVALIPRLDAWPREKIDARIDELMDLLGLSQKELRGRYPHQLSGGQRQRVGLARALAADPPILLMDEPFGALDPLTRVEVQQEFKSLQQRLRKTVVFVTHDVREALFLGTRIALLEDGHLVGAYPPAEFVHSRDPQVAAYIAALRVGEEGK
jgi:osmoprotectant transport system ATP-binding protein